MYCGNKHGGCRWCNPEHTDYAHYKRSGTLRKKVECQNCIALRAELANLRAMVAGQTAFHSDEAVNAELARLREENRVLRDALEIAMPAVEEVYTDCAPQYIKVKAALTGREG
jgi:hypothetical protein